MSSAVYFCSVTSLLRCSRSPTFPPESRPGRACDQVLFEASERVGEGLLAAVEVYHKGLGQASSKLVENKSI